MVCSCPVFVAFKGSSMLQSLIMSSEIGFGIKGPISN